ncbi:hypothetical protein [Pseudomonas aeruginosa]|uniref:hypothetical protein n=1 Tax=Pseudomonas aeruginosa TaxID=287 RepID=UPI001C628364|nr:hypothetical protein [Pseudomonas aeruginosa]
MIHFGYAPNDIAFLRNVQDVGTKFKMLFAIYAGLETELLEKNVGAKGLEHIWTYVPPSELDYPVNFGMTTLRSSRPTTRSRRHRSRSHYC